MLNVEELLKPISPDPCGVDLKANGGLFELDALLRGRPEAEEEIDLEWKKVARVAGELFQKSRDVRVAVVLCLVRLKEEGLPAFRDGLRLLRGLVEKYWDHFYPRLDAEDANDPTQRISIFNYLSSPFATDSPYRFVRLLQQTPLCQSARLGSYNLSDILIAHGEAKAAEGKAPPTPAAIKQVFLDSPREFVETNRQAAAESVLILRQIDEMFAARTEGRSPNFDPLLGVLDRIQQAIAAQFDGAVSEKVGEPVSENAPSASSHSPADSLTHSRLRPISSRDDVRTALRAVCDYYRRCEPSSPVPLLLERAERMVNMNFMDAMKELTPAALDPFKTIFGLKDEEPKQ